MRLVYSKRCRNRMNRTLFRIGWFHARWWARGMTTPKLAKCWLDECAARGILEKKLVRVREGKAMTFYRFPNGDADRRFVNRAISNCRPQGVIR